MTGEQVHLLVVGGQRCGTTYLGRLLDAHPDITMARPARPEPKVFLSDEATARGLAWYRQTWFAHACGERVLGEKSTSYLEDPAAPERAARMLGAPAVVAVLRDPVERAVSNWRFSTDHGLEQRTLEQALRENLSGARAWQPGRTSVSPYAYLERGRYAELLRPWHDRFPASTHVLFLQDLLDDPGAVADLYERLGVDASFVPPEPSVAVNESRAPAPALPEELLGLLRGYFAESDAALASLLGKDLPWPS